MRTLFARNFDRMPDLDRVKPVRDKRVSGESRQIGRFLDLESMHDPAGGRAKQECGYGRSNGRQPAVASAGQTIEIKPRWRSFIFQVAITLAQQLGLLAPRGNARGF